MNTAATPAQTEGFMGPGLRRDDGEVEGGALAAWSRALGRFREADAALAALAHTPDQDRYDRAGSRHDRALVRLLRTPAPHAAALADKIDLLIAHQAWEYRAGEACLATLRADARRLAAA
jgi:hypothetical protein